MARAVAAADPGEICAQDPFAPLLAEVDSIASEAPAARAAPRQPQAFVAAPAVSPAAPAEAPAPAAAPASSSLEAAARAAWLAKQETPSWGRQVAAVAAECDEGDAEACDSLLNEEEARLRWLARQDAPAWGQGATAAVPIAPADDEVIVRTMTSSLLIDDTALLAAASEAAAWLAEQNVRTEGQGGAAPATSEAAAKAAWLAKQEVPSWGKDVTAGAVVAGAVAEAEQEEAEQAIGAMGDMLDVLASLPEEEAKRAWLAGQGGSALVPPPHQAIWQERGLQELCEEEVQEACDTISLEEEAKQAWLAKQDAPALRGSVASPPPPLAAAATEAEVLAQGERLLNEPGLNLTEQEKEAVRMAMAIIRRG